MDKLIEKFSKMYTPEQTELFSKAVAFAKRVHAEQLRESGEPYYIHRRLSPRLSWTSAWTLKA